jgi:DNA replication and repair protein RecF
MTVDKLELLNFRNYRDLSVSFSPEINVISGNNAGGKTNLIESIYYLSALRPIRSAKDRDLVTQGQTEAKISAAIGSGAKNTELCAVLSICERKKLFKNGIRQKTGADFAGVLKTVLFCPDDLLLIKESGAQRRKLIDSALCQLRPSYYAALAGYNRLLDQKNKILREYQEKPSLLEMLPSYNDKMAELGGRLIFMRNAYVKLLASAAEVVCGEVSGGADRLSIRYCSLSNIADTSLSEKELSDLIREHQRDHRQAELASMTCLSGPHKDDIAICINGKSAKIYASQGQIRSAVLSLKLAERDIFFRDSGEYPALLLDDVLSELDPGRQSFVLNRISGGQVFITCCSVDKDAAFLSGNKYIVKNGRVTEAGGI